MATIEEARRVIQSRLGRYRLSRPTRTAYLGDGRGYAASNLYYPERADLMYARESLSGNYFVVVNDSVRPMHNLPVILGYTEDDPDTERVLNTNIAILGQYAAASALLGPGTHHTQHEWEGGDEVFLDSRQFKPGLVLPTDPPGMQLKVLGFTYFYETWNYYSGGNTIDLTIYRPSSGARYVTIALDPETGSLIYIPGPFTTGSGSWSDFIESGGFATFSSKFPAPGGGSYPLAVILIDANMTAISWKYGANYTIFDARLHVGYPAKHVNERIDALEGGSGNNQDLPMMGIASSTTDDYFTVDGGLF